MSFHVPEKHRLTYGPMRSDSSYGNNGVFLVSSIKFKGVLTCIASDGEGWEHVSVSLPNRTPTWEEMCIVKRLFWDAEDCVIQYHPPESTYVNKHKHCLHLWRQIGYTVPVPPTELVG